MIADAERYRSEDADLRQEVEARNELDAVAHQVERQVNALGDQIPVHEKARAEMLVADARQAVKESAPLDRLRSLTAELQQVYHSLSAGRPGGYGSPGPGSGGPPSGGRGSSGPASGGDDVIDADFTVS
jgi:molecular chaperone DnaK